jgi:hypothetical protein
MQLSRQTCNDVLRYFNIGFIELYEREQRPNQIIIPSLVNLAGTVGNYLHQSEKLKR